MRNDDYFPHRNQDERQSLAEQLSGLERQGDIEIYLQNQEARKQGTLKPRAERWLD